VADSEKKCARNGIEKTYGRTNSNLSEKTVNLEDLIFFLPFSCNSVKLCIFMRRIYSEKESCRSNLVFILFNFKFFDKLKNDNLMIIMTVHKCMLSKHNYIIVILM